MQAQVLKALFCEHFNCPPAAYEDRALTHCLYSHARVLAPFVRLLNADFFRIDFEFIRALGGVSHSQEADREILTFQDANRATKSFWRTGLNIRVSGRKTAALARELFAHSNSGARCGLVPIRHS